MRGHCCLEQRRSDAVAGSLFLKRKRGSRGATVLLPQGRKQYSSSAEYPLLSAPGKGKELVHAAPRRCSWMLEGCHCNCEDCTYLQRNETVSYMECPELFSLKQAGIFRKLKTALFSLSGTEPFHTPPALSSTAEMPPSTTGRAFRNGRFQISADFHKTHLRLVRFKWKQKPHPNSTLLPFLC